MHLSSMFLSVALDVRRYVLMYACVYVSVRIAHLYVYFVLKDARYYYYYVRRNVRRSLYVYSLMAPREMVYDIWVTDKWFVVHGENNEI